MSISSNARDLMIVARAVVEGGPYEAIEPILRGEASMRGVSPRAMRLLEDTLAKGCALTLARAGGWRSIPRVGTDGVKPARLWEAHPAALAFSPFSFELLRWLVTQPLIRPTRIAFDSRPRTGGDELLAYLTCALVEGHALEPVIAEQPGVRMAPLAWLGFTRMLVGTEGKAHDVEGPTAGDFERLLENGAAVVEGLGEDLARRAAHFEQRNGELHDPLVLRKVAEARSRALGLFVDGVEKKNRWDMATFLVDAGPALSPRTENLDPSSPLGDRVAARRAAGGHLRVLGRLAQAHENAKVVRFFEEDYGAAQALLARWESFGNSGFSCAAEALAHLDGLDGG